MKMIHEDLCRVITDLEVICGTLDSLRKRIEVTMLPVRLDHYYKILLAFKGAREIIEILGGMIEKTESVRSTTQNDIPEPKGPNKAHQYKDHD